jgi:TRAP-type C4-dicarboxylate transport system substrate-binding protein
LVGRNRHPRRGDRSQARPRGHTSWRDIRFALAFPEPIPDTAGNPFDGEKNMSKHFSGAATARLIACGLAAGLVAAAAGGACAQDNKAMVVKLATATLNDAQHEWLKRFAAKIEKSTNGRMKAEIYPASQLGAIPRMIEGTQLGSIQIWVGPPEFLVGVDQRFELLSVPGLFKDDQHSLKTIADPDFAKAFMALGANKGLIGASLFWTGPYAFDMRAPVRTLADIKGKKIRVLASPFQMEQMARLGATGVPLSLGDVMPALQQGTLDGALSSLPVFSALQYQGAAKYMTETSHAYIFSVAMLSKKWFDALPPDLQAAVRQAADETKGEVIPWSLTFLEEQRKVWVSKGGEILHLSDAEHAELMTKMRPVGDDIVKSKPELKPLWDLLIAAATKAK